MSRASGGDLLFAFGNGGRVGSRWFGFRLKIFLQCGKNFDIFFRLGGSVRGFFVNCAFRGSWFNHNRGVGRNAS